MFQGKAEEAMNFYVLLFQNAEVLELKRFGAQGPGAEGSVMQARFSLGDQTIFCVDSAVKHAFTFTPASSLFVECETEDEARRLHDALSADGATFMPLGSYGFSIACSGG
jgi:predicted 3-demethylubiquinone-9 3-methyltransferase (glyoxalase superfamily)